MVYMYVTPMTDLPGKIFVSFIYQEIILSVSHIPFTRNGVKFTPFVLIPRQHCPGKILPGSFLSESYRFLMILVTFIPFVE